MTSKSTHIQSNGDKMAFKKNIQRILSVILIVFGVLILLYGILVEDEPTAVSLFMISAGILWLFLLRKRSDPAEF